MRLKNCEKRLLVSSYLSDCPSVRPFFRMEPGFRRAGLYEIYLNIYLEICGENPSFIKMTKITDTLHEDP
jgi:hypothetical protein